MPQQVRTLTTIALPFRPGQQNFPIMVEGVSNVVFSSIRNLVLTGRNERVMRADLGTNAHAFIFENMSDIQRARVASDVARAIALYEPRAEVLSVEARDGADEGIEDTAVVVNVVWKVANQLQSQQIPFPASSGIGTP
jgi:phage baseplate assembly protein W